MKKLYKYNQKAWDNWFDWGLEKISICTFGKKFNWKNFQRKSINNFNILKYQKYCKNHNDNLKCESYHKMIYCWRSG